MKDSVRQNLKIALFAVLFLVAAVFSILSLMPEHTAVEVREKFTVSASRLSGCEAQLLSARPNKRKPRLLERNA